MFRTLSLAGLLLSSALILNAQDFDLKGKWYLPKNATVKLNGNSLNATFPKTEKKITFASLATYYNQKPLNLTGFQKIEIKFTTSEKIKLAITISDRKGSLSNVWPKETYPAGTHTVMFDRADFKLKNEIDLAKISHLVIGCGLWMYDTTEKPLNLTIDSIRVIK